MSARVYYNDNDSFACDWLAELMKDGLIAQGDIDRRSITDIDAADLKGYTRCHFFAGIGGWEYALQLAGWPDDAEVWTGSCPCQPFSSAGKRKGTDDERHLWPAFSALIAERRPATVFGEQVASKDGRAWLAGVCADVEALGYRAAGADLCAAGVGAPHIRQRLWWVADAQGGDGEVPVRERGQEQESLESGGRGGDGGLADAEHGRSGERLGREQEEAGLGRHRLAECGVGSFGLADPGSGGRHGGAFEPGRAAIKRTASTGASQVGVALGDTDSPRPQGRRKRGLGSDQWAVGSTGVVRCEEPGRTVYRRAPLEPALFPLATRISNRVGILRGAGNAIVPQVAAEFVMAYMEAAS